jgi:hypothetical protein
MEAGRGRKWCFNRVFDTRQELNTSFSIDRETGRGTPKTSTHTCEDRVQGGEGEEDMRHSRRCNQWMK